MLMPFCAHVLAAAHGGNGISVAGGTAMHDPVAAVARYGEATVVAPRSTQRQSRPSDHTQSSAVVISGHGCGGGGGGGSAHPPLGAAFALHVHRGVVRHPAALQCGVPNAASHAFSVDKVEHLGSGQGPSGRHAVPGSGQLSDPGPTPADPQTAAAIRTHTAIASHTTDFS